MPYASLRDFIDRLEREKRLVRVKAPVSPVLEMTEIQTRLLAEGGPAVLFENVVGPGGDGVGRRYEMPVLVNLFVPLGLALEAGASALAIAFGLYFVKVFLLAMGVTLVEVTNAKLRLFRVPELMAASLGLGFLALAIRFL